jgi:hypothetical protein
LDTLNHAVLNEEHIVIGGWLIFPRNVIYCKIIFIITNILFSSESSQNKNLSKTEQDCMQDNPQKVPHSPTGWGEKDRHDSKKGSVETNDGNVIRGLKYCSNVPYQSLQ